jgi:hypothetical protein
VLDKLNTNNGGIQAVEPAPLIIPLSTLFYAKSPDHIFDTTRPIHLAHIRGPKRGVVIAIVRKCPIDMAHKGYLFQDINNLKNTLDTLAPGESLFWYPRTWRSTNQGLLLTKPGGEPASIQSYKLTPTTKHVPLNPTDLAHDHRVASIAFMRAADQNCPVLLTPKGHPPLARVWRGHAIGTAPLALKAVIAHIKAGAFTQDPMLILTTSVSHNRGQQDYTLTHVNHPGPQFIPEA